VAREKKSCSVFLRLNKTPKKTPSKESSIAEGGVQKNGFYVLFSLG
jgi:hypothetical protein